MSLKAKAGQPVTAERWNRVVDRLENTTAGLGAGGFAMSRVECLIKNVSGNNRDIGELLAITGWDGTDGSNVFDLHKSVVYTCDDPVWHTAISRVVVLAEPIPDGQYGRAVLSGQCVVKLSSGSDSDQFVMIDPESVNECVGATSGIGRLIAKPATGDYALVNFRDEQTLWRYELTADSGAPGTTGAKLVGLDGEVVANTISLSDPLGLMDDQLDGDIGYCMQAGNEFHADNAPCGHEVEE